MRSTDWFRLAALLVCGATLAVGQPQYKVLYTFGTNGGPDDAAGPKGKLLMDKLGNLYGTTYGGGLAHAGAVFKLTLSQDGTWSETVLYSFCSQPNCLDGAGPAAGLISDKDGNLYGTARTGGQGVGGVVFKLSPPAAPGGGWTQTVLYTFDPKGSGDGCSPMGKLVFDTSGNLYGTTSSCGPGDAGSVFQLTPLKDGTWKQNVLYNFCKGGDFSPCPDGSQPKAGVTFDALGNLYGTTELGGSKQFMGVGVVYRLTPGPQGWTETVLYNFSTPGHLHGTTPTGQVNFDALGNMYSTVGGGGQFGAGGVFRLSPSRNKEYTLSFSGGALSQPIAGVLIDPRNGNLYGTARGTGEDHGSVFKIVGKKVTTVYAFTGASDGGRPIAALIADKKGHLYGTTEVGGGFDQGVVFEIIP